MAVSQDALDDLTNGLLAEFGLVPDAVPTLRMGPPAPVAQGTPLLYLDINHWVSLAQARTGHQRGAPFAACYQALIQATADGRAVIVLSSGTYMEMALAIPSVRHRTDLADVMSELSRFRTLRRRSHLLEAQIERALHDRLGRPAFPTHPRVIGRGAMWAFSGEEIFPRLDGTAEVIAQFIQNTGPQQTARLLVLFAEVTEYLLLRGARPEDVAKMPSYNLDPVRHVEQERLDRDRQLDRMLAADPVLRRRLDDILMARELYWELGPELPRVLAKGLLSVDSFFYKGKDWITSFLSDLPSIAVQAAVRRHVFKRGSNWVINNQRDLDHLSVAVPYCDVVVTDTDAAEALTRAGLDSRLNTIVLADLNDLPGVLGL